MASFNLEEEVGRLNVTLDELKAIQKADAEKKFKDTASLVAYLDKIRAAQDTLTKPNNQIYFDEIKESWNTVKDAQDGLLGGIKQKLRTKSEEMLSGDTSQIDETNAAELDEWLKINDMRDDLSEEQKKRNKKLHQRIKTFYKKYDRENGLKDLSPKNELRMVQTQTELNTMRAEAFPYRKENGRSVINGDEFREIVDFYTKLQLTDDNGRLISPEDKAKFFKNMVDIAQNKSITQLSLDKDFATKSATEKQQIFKQSVAANMQAGIVELLVAKTTAEMTEEQRQSVSESAFKEQARARLANLANQENISMPHEIALSSLASSYAHWVNMNRRISQKTDNMDFRKKAREKFQKFAHDHPKIANVAKIMGTVGLTAGLAMTAGPAGMAALSAYRAYKIVRKQGRLNRRQTWKDTFKNPRQVVALATAVAGTAIAGIGAFNIGLGANGMIGNALGGGMDGSAGEIAQKMAQQRAGRLLVGAGSTLARLSMDIADAIRKPEHKGQRKKAIRNAIGRALFHGGIAVAAYEYGTHQAAAHTAETSHASEASHINETPQVTNAPAPHEPTPHISETPHVSEPSQATNAPINASQDSVPTHDWGIKTPEWASQYAADQESIENIQQPYAPGMTPHTIETPQAAGTSPEGYTESPENLQRWENRIDKFLGKTEQADEIKARIYGMIDKGEINLPKGIETKEEYLYKMVMKMEQRPADIRADLGDEFKSTLSREQTLMTMTADDLNKVSHDLNDYSDKGVYHGSNGSGMGHHRLPSDNSHNDSPINEQKEEPVIQQEQKNLDEPIIQDPLPPQGTDKVPSHETMNAVNRMVRAEYKQLHNFNQALQSSLAKAVSDGHLTPEEIKYTEQIFNETYQAHHENPLATFKDIDKTSAKMAAEEASLKGSQETVTPTTHKQTENNDYSIGKEIESREVSAEPLSRTYSKGIEGHDQTESMSDQKAALDTENTSTLAVENTVKGKDTNSGISGIVKYRITGDENNFNMECEGSASFSQNLVKTCEEKTYVDPDTGQIICGGSRGTIESVVERIEKLNLNSLAAHHLVYHDLLEKQAHGEEITPAASKWMELHKKMLSAHNLKIDENGQVIYDDDKLKEKLGLEDKKSLKNFMQKQTNIMTDEFSHFNWKSYIKGY